MAGVWSHWQYWGASDLMRAFKENREGNKLILTVFRCRWRSTNKWPVSENKSQNSNYENFRILSRRILCFFFIMRLNVLFPIQFSSVAQSCPTLWDPMNCSTPGLPVRHQLPEFTQTHVHRVGDAIQPSRPLSSPSPPASSPSQHQSFPVSQLFAYYTCTKSHDYHWPMSCLRKVYLLQIPIKESFLPLPPP